MNNMVIIVCLMLVVLLFQACEKQERVELDIILVKVPPFYDTNLTSGQNYWLWQEFLFPDQNSREFPTDTIPDEGIPNDDSLLFVVLQENGSLRINSELAGDIYNTEQLTDRLSNVFEERTRAGVFEPGNWKIVKAVGIRIPRTVRYGDAIEVAQAVKKSGADPIILLLDGHLPMQTIIIENQHENPQ